MKIGILYFSPTGTTKKVCVSIAKGMHEEHPRILNITQPTFRAKFQEESETYLSDIDHLIVGAPVYAGKLPLPVIETLTTVKVKNKQCTCVVVYGNRDYGVALRDLVERMTNNGFSIKGAGAFIGQHSYYRIIPVAMGRPDVSDLKIARSFGATIAESGDHLSPEQIPVQLDRFSRSQEYSALVPTYVTDRCTKCHKCAVTCPMAIISAESGDYINETLKTKCVGCMACVNACEFDARTDKISWVMKLMVRLILRKASATRTEPLIMTN